MMREVLSGVQAAVDAAGGKHGAKPKADGRFVSAMARPVVIERRGSSTVRRFFRGLN